MSFSTEINPHLGASDLDWDHIRETVVMLELSSGQIEGALTDSNNSVEVLTSSFTTMAGYMGMISETVAELSDEGAAGATKESLQAVAGSVSGMVHDAIMAFQFYDKLVQRLAHVNHSLSELSGLIGDDTRHFDPAEWKVLQETIRSKYSMKEEQAMFDAVMHGVPVKQALEQFMLEMKGKQGDDIELF